MELLKNKKKNLITKQKVEIANLLRNKEEELARIRTEHIVVEDFFIEVLDILGLLCALLEERSKLLESSETIPYDMRESIMTLAYASDRIHEIPELVEIKSILALKFGKDIKATLHSDSGIKENVNERVLEKLSIKPPNGFIVTSYMKHIAEDNGLDWEPKPDIAKFDLPAPSPTGLSVAPGSGSGIKAPYVVTNGALSSVPTPQIKVDPMFPTSNTGNENNDGGSSLSIPPMFADNSLSSSATPRVLGAATVAANANARKKKDDEFVTLNHMVSKGQSLRQDVFSFVVFFQVDRPLHEEQLWGRNHPPPPLHRKQVMMGKQ